MSIGDKISTIVFISADTFCQGFLRTKQIKKERESQKQKGNLSVPKCIIITGQESPYIYTTAFHVFHLAGYIVKISTIPSGIYEPEWCLKMGEMRKQNGQHIHVQNSDPEVCMFSPLLN